MPTLVLAAGGGGDALGALLLRRLLPHMGSAPLVATLAWERLRIDPVPGPRGRDGFSGLKLIDNEPAEILPSTHTVPVGRSSLPRLAREAPGRLFLLDPHHGAGGLADQVRHLSNALNVDRLLVVDIGGDVVAAGNEKGLRSPLADALILCSAHETALPTDVVVAGPGTDGELAEEEVIARITQLGGRSLGALTPDDINAAKGLLAWHPTEASALLAAASRGLRGMVSIGRSDLAVPLTDRSPTAWLTPLADVLSGNALAHALLGSTSLEEAHQVAASGFVSELAYERAKAKLLPSWSRTEPPTLARLSAIARDLESKGARYVTHRSLAERLHAVEENDVELVQLLNTLPEARRDPLWDVRTLACAA